MKIKIQRLTKNQGLSAILSLILFLKRDEDDVKPDPLPRVPIDPYADPQRRQRLIELEKRIYYGKTVKDRYI